MPSIGSATSDTCTSIRSVSQRRAALCLRALVVSVAAMIELVPGPAPAHAIVVSATPEMNSAVPPGVTEIRLEFNSRIDLQRSRLRLMRPDGSEAAIRTESDAPPNVLAGQIDATLPGRWTLDWQVLSIDGHITRGRLPFSIRDAAH